MSLIEMVRFAVESLFPAPLPLSVGDGAPDFQATDQNERRIQLSEYLGKRVVLWFFPRVNTPG